MKILRLLFVGMNCVVLLQGTSFARRSGQDPAGHAANAAGQRLTQKRAGGSGETKSHNMKQAFIWHETARSALPARPATVVSPVRPALSNAGHHGPNPPLVGGPINSSTNKNGAMNGSAMKSNR
jgi:hypothetical protein